MVDSAPKWTMRRCRRESDRNGRRQCRYRAGARRNVPNMVDSRPKWTMLAPMMARFAFLLPCSRPSWRPHGRFRAWSIFCRRGPCWARKKGKQKPPQPQKKSTWQCSLERPPHPRLCHRRRRPPARLPRPRDGHLEGRAPIMAFLAFGNYAK